MGKIMPQKDTQFKGDGIGIPHSIMPISVKYPSNVDLVLRSLSNRSEYIRDAVIKQLQRDGLI